MSVTFGGQHVALGVRGRLSTYSDNDPNYRADEQDSDRLPND